MPKKSLNLTFEEDLIREMKAYSEKCNIPVSQIMADAYMFFRNYLYLANNENLIIDKKLFGVVERDYENIPLSKKKYEL